MPIEPVYDGLLPLERVTQTEFYMDKIDFDFHLDGDRHGAKAYKSLKDLLADSPCCAGGTCGIVKVRIELIEVLQYDDVMDSKTELQRKQEIEDLLRKESVA